MQTITTGDPAQLTLLAIGKLQEYIDLHLLKMKWAFFCTLLGMFSGLTIIGLGIIKLYESPGNIRTCLISSGIAFFVEFFSAAFFVIYRLAVVKARDSMLILQGAAALSSGKKIILTRRNPVNLSILPI